MSDSADGAVEPKERPLDCSVGASRGSVVASRGSVVASRRSVVASRGSVMASRGVSDGVKGEHVNTVARLSTE